MKLKALIMVLAIYEVLEAESIVNLIIGINPNIEEFENENNWIENIYNNEKTCNYFNEIMATYNKFSKMPKIQVFQNSKYLRKTFSMKAKKINWVRNVEAYISECIFIFFCNYDVSIMSTYDYNSYLKNLYNFCSRYVVPKNIEAEKSEYFVNEKGETFRKETLINNTFKERKSIDYSILRDEEFFNSYKEINTLADNFFSYDRNKKFYYSIIGTFCYATINEFNTYLRTLDVENIKIANTAFSERDIVSLRSNCEYGVDDRTNRPHILCRNWGRPGGNISTLKKENSFKIDLIYKVFYCLKNFVYINQHIPTEENLITDLKKYDLIDSYEEKVLREFNTKTLILALAINIQLEYVLRDTDFSIFDIAMTSMRIGIQSKYLNTLEKNILEYDNPYYLFNCQNSKSTSKVNSEQAMLLASYESNKEDKLFSEVKTINNKNNVDTTYQEISDLIEMFNNIEKDILSNSKLLNIDLDKLKNYFVDVVNTYTYEDPTQIAIYKTANRLGELSQEEILLINEILSNSYFNNINSKICNIQTKNAVTKIFILILLKYFNSIKKVLISSLENKYPLDFLKFEYIYLEDKNLGTIESSVEFIEDIVNNILYEFNLYKNSKLRTLIAADLISLKIELEKEIIPKIKSLINKKVNNYSIETYINNDIIYKAVKEDYLGNVVELLDKRLKEDNLTRSIVIGQNYKGLVIKNGSCLLDGGVINYNNIDFKV